MDVFITHSCAAAACEVAAVANIMITVASGAFKATLLKHAVETTRGTFIVCHQGTTVRAARLKHTALATPKT